MLSTQIPSEANSAKVPAAALTESDLILPEHPTLEDYQNYVKQLKTVRGFPDDLKIPVILCLKELGELAQVTRQCWGPDGVSNELRISAARELADVFIYLSDIANQLGVSLAQAFAQREEENKARDWQPYHLYK